MEANVKVNCEFRGCGSCCYGHRSCCCNPAALKSAGLKVDDIDLFDINEAFASQFVYCSKKLQLDPRKVNINGGAMAIGHPLGATGARCVATLLHEMKRRGKDSCFGVVSMCIGSGMGTVAVFERAN